MRVLPSGELRYCRWMEDKKNPIVSNLKQNNFLQYFQKEMSSLRLRMLQGESIDSCGQCAKMEEHGKVSGREKQLLKVGIKLDNFEKTFISSTYYDEFKKSANSNGDTEVWPQDWQIDLGNYCNSACIFCSPIYSSKLANEFKKLGLTRELPANNWTDDEDAVDRFVELLSQSKKLSYLHFLGGETLITPAFKKILIKLKEKGLHENTSIGFTTNLTVWDDSIIELLKEYKEVNLGMSVECLHPINDYLRWPSNIDKVKGILDKWLQLGKKQNWLIQFRITPTIFSIAHVKTIYDYAYTNDIGVESCDFLYNPSFMRMSVLPRDVRQNIAGALQNWINSKKLLFGQDRIINTSWPALVSYIKKLESSRNNSILNYAPEYEKLLRSAGY